MTNRIAKLLITLLAGALLIYTAMRTYDLLARTLPADQEIVGILALFAFDVGLVLWTLYFIKGAKGGWQRGISVLMIFTSFVGVAVAFGADTLITAQAEGTIADVAPEVVNVAIWATVAVISLNILAVTGLHVTDPDVMRKMGEEERLDRRQEAEIKAQSRIELAALEKLEANADTLADEMAPILAAAWKDGMRARYMASVNMAKAENTINPTKGGPGKP